jgi:hypothetical protein
MDDSSNRNGQVCNTNVRKKEHMPQEKAYNESPFPVVFVHFLLDQRFQILAV